MSEIPFSHTNRKGTSSRDDDRCGLFELVCIIHSPLTVSLPCVIRRERDDAFEAQYREVGRNSKQCVGRAVTLALASQHYKISSPPQQQPSRSPSLEQGRQMRCD